MSLPSFLVTSSLEGANNNVSDSCSNFLRPENSEISFKESDNLSRASWNLEQRNKNLRSVLQFLSQVRIHKPVYQQYPYDENHHVAWCHEVIDDSTKFQRYAFPET